VSLRSLITCQKVGPGMVMCACFLARQALPYSALNTPQVSDLLYKKLMATELDITPRNLRVRKVESAAEVARKVRLFTASRGLTFADRTPPSQTDEVE
jgi:hypothetical protein